MAEEVVRVRIAEYRVARAPALLKITGLGSCVALALHDPEQGLGGLAHVLLPGPEPERSETSRANHGKYADRAVELLLAAVIAKGGHRDRLVAVIAGGSTMFMAPEEWAEALPLPPGIGERNVAAVREQLRRLAIPLRGEDVGGRVGRTVSFEPATGRVMVATLNGGSKII